MQTRPIDAWTAALDAMSAATARALADLDRHRADWAALTEVVSVSSAGSAASGLETRFDHWDERLTRAAELAAAVERDFDERLAEANRWHAAFARWMELLQQQPRSGPSVFPG